MIAYLRRTAQAVPAITMIPAAIMPNAARSIGIGPIQLKRSASQVSEAWIIVAPPNAANTVNPATTEFMRQSKPATPNGSL